MRIRLLALLLLAFITAAFAAVPSSVFFVENLGQWQGEFRYRAALGNGAAFVTESGLVLDLQSRDKGRGMAREHLREPWEDGGQDRLPEPVSVRGHVLRLTFLDASPCPEMLGLDKLVSYSNYFLGRDSSRWKSRVGHYQRVLSQEVWPKIDVEYVLTEAGVELVYQLHPGANPQDIEIQIEGLSSPLSPDASGNLILPTSLGPLTEQAPSAFQQGHSIPCHYRLMSDSTYSFALNNYNSTQELVIDPLLYSTYLGGWLEDEIDDLVYDSTRHSVWMGGTTASSDFPTTPGAYQTQGGADWNDDLFIRRISTDDHLPIFSTFLGGASTDITCKLLLQPNAILGCAGIVHSPDWPLTPNAIDTVYAGNGEGAFWRLSNDGTELLQSSYWGGAGVDYINDIQRDLDGRLYLVGRSGSTDLAVTADALYPVSQGFEPAFISVFDSTGTILLYSTFFPGSTDVYPNSLAVLAPMYVWIAGSTQGGITITANALQSQIGQTPYTAFLSRLNFTTGAVEYSSYFGGSERVSLYHLVPLNSNRIRLVGSCNSYSYADFPVTPDAFDTVRWGEKAFITELELPATIWHSTLFGSPTGSTTRGSQLAIDPVTGSIWIGGYTWSADLPYTHDAVDSVYTDPPDPWRGEGFVACFSSNLQQLLYGSYLGGSYVDGVRGLALVDTRHLWIGGYTESEDFPITADAYQPQPHGTGDAFLALLELPADTGDTSNTDPFHRPPSNFSLSCFPNPFNSATEIRYALPRAGYVALKVFDVLGREVSVLVDAVMVAGEQRVAFDARGIASGIYFVRLDAGEMRVTRKVLLVR